MARKKAVCVFLPLWPCMEDPPSSESYRPDLMHYGLVYSFVGYWALLWCCLLVGEYQSVWILGWGGTCIGQSGWIPRVGSCCRDSGPNWLDAYGVHL